MKNYDETIKFIQEAHKGQLDKAGEQYWLHPYKVSKMVGRNEATKIVALLHDVLEDTHYRVKDLREMGYSEEILRALMCLTHTKDLSYKEYIDNLVMTNPISIRVKMADLRHNMDESRLPERLKRTEKFIKRNEKYKRTYNKLEDYVNLSRETVLPTILGFWGIGTEDSLKLIYAIIVGDYPNKGMKRTINVTELGTGTFNFSNFTLRIYVGDIRNGFVSSDCFDKEDKGCSMSKYYNMDIRTNVIKNANTLVLCAKTKNDLFLVNGVNFSGKLLSKHDIVNLVNKGWVLANGTVRKSSGYAIVPNRALQRYSILKRPLTNEQYKKLEIKIDSAKIKNKMVKETNNEDYVQVTNNDKKIANSILHIIGTLDFFDGVLDNSDRSIIEDIRLNNFIEKSKKDTFYEIYKRICNISKEDVINVANVPKELKRVNSFMDMLKSESTLDIIDNIRLYKTFDRDEHDTYSKFISNADKVTENVKSISNELGLKLYGLEHRVKSPKSYCNKVRERCELVDKQEQLQSISDILRFTQVVKDLDNYGKIVNKSLNKFKELGYTIVQVKNFWGDIMPYKGINCKIESPEGVRFEMQYHTPEFLLVKDAMHTWYEIRRTGTRKGSEKWNYVVQQELELAKTVRTPKDYKLVKEVKL